MRAKQNIHLGLVPLICFLHLCSAQVIRTKVAVLGGGMAGVISARTLSENGISDFVIIEAESVLGGRMKQAQFGGYMIELGANWIQGTRNKETGKENPLWTLAKKYKLKSTLSDFESVLTYDQNGLTDYSDVLEQAFDKYDQVMEDAELREERKLKDLSFAQGLSLRGWTPRTSYEKLADWFAFDFEFADTPSASSMIGAAIGDDMSDDNRFVTDQRGFALLVREEANKFATRNNILYKSTVTKVTYSKSSVNITLKSGLMIVADYAICTFSLGVLQHNDVQFIPQFPAWKQESISTFKMATYTKIFLQFPYKFWNSKQFSLYADPYRRGYYPAWQSMSEIGFFPGSNILFVTVVTDQAYIVEAQSNNQTLMEIMAVLKSMYGQTVPKPNNSYYYRWTDDPLYRGSYSNWPVGASRCQHGNLRRSIGRLHFAGEAYSEEYGAYAHGAYMSGLETGQKVADYVLGKTAEKIDRDHPCTRN
ncbi:unnamed protein product [Rotaria magnacalcarata]|uniref:Amine oxidase n=1 Tax=Rotaria magnacalcarata TaxID=392030 RepID=A0A815RMC7_9BILA|nr:unnamed protein product [Rotaria magnacalcarata]CAF3880470.1 unnamed protein product [Rotaria magnacalcarata]